MADYTNPYLDNNNPYLQTQIDAAQGDIVRNWNKAVQPAYNSAMVKSGSFGNAGVNEMNQNAALDTQNALGRVSDSMRSQAYNTGMQNYQWDQGFNRSLYNDAYAQNANNLSTGIGLLGSLAGYNANDLTNANTIQNTPMNYYTGFSNAANSIGNGYSNQQMTAGTSSNPLVSALGGAQLGSQAYNYWNNYANPGYTASSNMSNYSTSPAWNNWVGGTTGMGD